MQPRMTRGRIGLVVALIAVGAVAAPVGVLLMRTPKPTEAAGPPQFVDETAASGVSQRFDGPETYQVGGGAAVFDCNGDRLPDLYLAGGEGPASLLRNRSAIGGALRFDRVASPITDLP